MTTPVTPDISSSSSSSPVHAATELLANARRIVVFSGAGLSRASGIPTYRDADGLWKNQNALQFSHAEDLQRDPSGFAKFWAQRQSAIESAQPNPGHTALALLQRLRPATRLVTQNVDGLLTLAGGQDVRFTANKSAQATVPMRATRGRASFLGERSIGCMDPGARSSALMISAVADVVERRI